MEILSIFLKQFNKKTLMTSMSFVRDFMQDSPMLKLVDQEDSLILCNE